jgi:hypothetical protein
MNHTIDGVTYSSPFSLGRAAALQVAPPGDPTFQLVSSLIDVPTRIGLDPINYPALAATRQLHRRRFFTPNAVQPQTGRVVARRRAVPGTQQAVPTWDLPQGVHRSIGPDPGIRPVIVDEYRMLQQRIAKQKARIEENTQQILDAKTSAQKHAYEGQSGVLTQQLNELQFRSSELLEAHPTIGNAPAQRSILDPEDLFGEAIDVGEPQYVTERWGQVLRGGAPDEVAVTAQTARGRWLELDPETALSFEAEGYVAHGSTDPSVKTMSEGGLTFNLERAAHYAGENGVVMVFPVKNLPNHIRHQLAAGGDIEQILRATTDEITDNLEHLKRQLADRIDEHDTLNRLLDDPEFLLPEPDEAIGMSKRQKAINRLDQLHDEIKNFEGQVEYQEAHLDSNQKLTFSTQELVPRKVFTQSEVLEAIDRGKLIFGDGGVITKYADAGLHHAGRRPWADGLTADKWLTTGRGKRVIEFLRQEMSMVALADWLPEIGWKAQEMLSNATKTEEVIAILRPHLGASLSQAPRIGPRRAVLGAKIPLDEASGWNAGISTLRQKDGGIGTFLERLAAESGGGLTVLNPMDLDESIFHAKNMMRSYGAQTSSIEKVLRQIVATGEASVTNLRKARALIADDLRNTLAARGWDDDVVLKIMSEFEDTQAHLTSYIINNVGEEVTKRGEKYTVITNPRTGNKIEFPMSQAIYESQFAHQNVFMPDVRVVRRATAGVRKVTNQLRGSLGAEVLGMEPSQIQNVLDMYTAAWRSMTLLRIGWTLRVLPDEIARGLASGYGTLGDADVYLAMIIGKGKIGILGDSLDSFNDLRGLGAGTLKQMGAKPGEVGADLIAGTRFDKRNRNWGTVLQANNPDQWRVGLATEMIEAFSDEIVSLIYEYDTIDDLMVFLRSAEGKPILDRYAQAASVENNWSKVNHVKRGDFWLKQQLEMVEAHVAKVSGGDIYTRKWHMVDDAAEPVASGRMGPWLDKYGEELGKFDYMNMTHRELDAKLRAANVPGRTMRGGRKVTKKEKASMLYKAEGRVDLTKVRGDQAYVVESKGSEAVQELLAKGTHKGETVLSPEMTLKEMRAFEAKADKYFGSQYLPMEVQRVPLGQPIVGTKRRTVDTLFYLLGQMPTNTIVRSPFAKARYWDNMGRMYAFSDDAIRKKIRQLAVDAGEDAPKFLDVGINRYLDQMGHKTLPKVAEGGLGISIEDMDELAKNAAIQQTKDLFYDLSNKSNIADMAKHIAPFADAWWEILSTWGRLINPYKVGGRAVQNIRRASQGIDSARRSGWFQEDEFGNEVFSWWPDAGQLGWLDKPGNLGVTGHASLAQAMFVDVGSPRSWMMPGASPMFQAAASWFEPKLPGPLGAAADWLGNGDFPGQDLSDIEDMVTNQLPTYMGRFLGRINTSLFAREWANEQVTALNSLLVSGDPKYPNTIEGHARAVEDARILTEGLAWGSILNAFILPASPRVQIEYMEETLDVDQPEFFLDIIAIGREYATAQEYMGPEEAVQYIHDKFGLNPLNEFEYTGTSRAIYERPVDTDSWEYYQQHPELLDYAPKTLMAWVPNLYDSEFNQDAWIAWKKGDPTGVKTREVVDMNMAGNMINNRRAYKAYNQIVDVYDKAIEDAAMKYGKNTPMYRVYRDEAERLRDMEINDLKFDYMGFEPGDTVEEVTAKPSGHTFIAELRNIADPNSLANAALGDLNPELVGFVEFMMGMWHDLEQAGLAEDHSGSWWLTSTSQTNPLVERRKEWFQQNLQNYYQRLDDPIAQTGAQWYADRLLTFVINGYSLEEPFILDVGQVPAPPMPTQSDIVEPEYVIPNG